jgi:quinol monooxygenase YgiN
LIIVLGSIVAHPETFEALLDLSLEHVNRSRREDGCLSHAVHVDADNPLRLVFVEKWRDAAALGAHFKVQASIDFVSKARELGADAPIVEIFEATAADL